MKKNIYYFLFLLNSFVFSCIYLKGQSYLVHKYLKEDGLPSNIVFDVCQDKNANMWFSTKSGITRYDGTEWTYFKQNNPSAKKEYKFISKDSDGNIWAISDNSGLAISEFDGNSWSEIFVSDAVEFHTGIITSFILLEKNGKKLPLYASDAGGLFILYNKELNSVQKLSKQRINSLKIFNSVCYIVTDKLVYTTSDGQKFPVLNLSQKLPANFSIKDISVDKSGKIYFLGDGEIAEITDTKMLVHKLGYSPEKIFIDDYYGSLVLGGSGVILLWDKISKNSKRISSENGLSADGANEVFADMEKNLWIAGNKGVNKIAGFRFSNYTQTQDLLNDKVSSLISFEGEIFAGHPEGISILQGLQISNIKFPITNRRISKSSEYTNLYKTSNGIIVSSSAYGFGYLKNYKIQWINTSSHKNEKAVAVSEDNSGKIYCVTDASLYEMNGFNLIKIPFPENFDGIKINNITADRGNIYIATNGDGIICFNKDNKWQQIFSKDVYSNNIVYTVVVIGNILFAGTAEGIASIQGNDLQSFEIGGKNLQEAVYALFPDKNNTLWIGTGSGVYKYNGTKMMNYGPRQGLAGLEIGVNSIIQNSENILIGTDNGLSVYSSEFDYNNFLGPIVSIESIEAGGKRISVFENNSVSFSNNNLIFKINVGSFIDEKLNRYSVKLDGYDNKWIENIPANQKLLQYSNLPPGKYKLLVKAKDALGNWSSPIATGTINIKIPFYKETWFFLSLIILTGIIIFSMVIYFERARYAGKLETEVAERTKQVEDSRKRYHLMFENNQAVLLIVDGKTGDIVDVNNSAKGFYGKDFTKSVKIKFNELNADIANIKNEKISLAKSYYTIKHKAKNGIIKDVEVYISRFASEEEDLFFIIIHDITEKRQSEVQIKKLTAAVEQSSHIIFITNTEGAIEYVNPTFCSITGFSKKEALGNNPRILKSGKRNNEEYKRMWDTISAGNNWSGEFLNRKKNGEYIWVSALVTPVRTGGNRISHYLAVEEDITEKKKAQEELVKSEAKIKAILNAIPDLMMQITVDGRLAGCHYCEDIMQISDLTDNIGRNIEDVFPKEFANILLDKVIQTVKLNKLQKFDHKFGVNGSEKYYECRLIRNDEKTVLVILRDVTQQKLYEKDIILAKEEAEKSDKLKTEFLAQMSHEIRTPVNSIVNFAELIRENLAEKLSPHVFERISYIEQSSKRLIKTIDSIIEIAKIQSGLYQAEFSDFNIVTCLTTVINELEQTAADKNIVLWYTAKYENINVYADYNSVRSIFYHLLDNAIKFTNAGKVKVNLDILNDSEVRIDFIDTGAGISEEFFAKIFNAFSQENTGYSRNFEGNGLGLALVKSYCEMNNIRIEFTSEKGTGSTFSVYFTKMQKKIKPII